MQFTQEFFGDVTNAFTLFLLMLLFGWAAIPFTYSFQFAFKSAPKGYMLIVIFNVITGKIFFL